jgi:hypothetical protein
VRRRFELVFGHGFRRGRWQARRAAGRLRGRRSVRSGGFRVLVEAGAGRRSVPSGPRWQVQRAMASGATRRLWPRDSRLPPRLSFPSILLQTECLATLGIRHGRKRPLVIGSPHPPFAHALTAPHLPEVGGIGIGSTTMVAAVRPLICSAGEQAARVALVPAAFGRAETAPVRAFRDRSSRVGRVGDCGQPERQRRWAAVLGATSTSSVLGPAAPDASLVFRRCRHLDWLSPGRQSVLWTHQ